MMSVRTPKPGRRFPLAILVWIFLILCVNLEAFSITGIEPEYAVPGESVDISLSGWDPVTNVSVNIGGIEANVASKSTDGLQIEIPQNAISGQISIQEQPSGDPVTSAYPFRVVSPVQVSIDPAISVSANQMTAVSFFEQANMGSGNASVRVVTGAPNLLMAVHDAGYPVLMAMVTDPSEPVEFSAASTVEALAFTTGLYFTDVVDAAETRFTEIRAMPSFGQAVALIEQHLLDNTDYTQDTAFDTLMGNISSELLEFFANLEALNVKSAMQKLAAPADAEFDPNVFQDDVVQGVWDFTPWSPMDIAEPTTGNFGIYNVLNTAKEELSVSREGLPVRVISFKPPTNESSQITKFNVLDWLAVIHELNPSQFDFGGDEVALISDEDYSRVFTRLDQDPVALYHIPASGGATEEVKKWTPAGWMGAAVDAVNDTVFPKPPQGKLAIRLDRPAIYLIRIYSGSLFTPQNDLISSIPDGAQYKSRLFAHNLLQTAIAGSNALLGATNALDGMDYTDLALNTSTELISILTTKEIEQGLEASDLQWLLPALLRTMVGNGMGEMSKVGGEALGWILRVQGVMFSASGADERQRALISGGDCTLINCPNLSSVQTVETAVIMVGDPFAPMITSFEPLSGLRGQIVSINGTGFSNKPENNRVEFNVSPSTSPDQQPTAPAEVLAARDTRLVVAVPENAVVGKGPIRVQVLVDGSNNGTVLGVAESSRLRPPLNEFEVIEDPAITEVNPSPVVVGSPMRIIGERFPTDSNKIKVTYNNSGFELSILNIISESEILVQAPTFETSLNVTIHVTDLDSGIERTSNTVPVSVVAGSGEQGWGYTVNSLADTVAPDSEVTLREAMMWASGTSGIHNPTDDELLVIDRGVPQRPTGAGVADSIGIPNLGNQEAPIVLTSPLPPMTSYDYFNFNRRELDGSAVVGIGFDVQGEDIQIDAVSLSGVQGIGMNLEGAKRGRFDNIFINGCTGTGVYIHSGSQYNSFVFLEANSCGGHGVHLSGPETAYNSFTFTFDSIDFEYDTGSTNGNSGWGVLVDMGANGNSIEIGESVANTLGGLAILGSDSTGNSVGGNYTAALAPYLLINDNLGPGVRVEASDTRLRFIHSSGNEGDGIVVEGAVENIEIHSARIGFYPDGVPNENKGSGIHFLGGVSNSSIGQESVTYWNRDPRMSIGGNRDHGIFLEDASDIQIRYTDIGTSIAYDQLAENGGHGIYLLNSSNCRIGANRMDYEVTIVGSTNGAGIRMEGANTFGNEVFGTSIGSSRNPFTEFNHYFPDTNMYGVHITGQAWGNVIGRRGWWLSLNDEITGDPFAWFLGQSIITGSSEAGVLIESGLRPTAEITANDIPIGGNVVQGCDFFVPDNQLEYGNRINIILRGDARGNRIGGTTVAEENYMLGFREVGIHVDGVDIPMPNLANRIIGNFIRQTWNIAPSRPTDFPQTIPANGQGIGILVTNSSNQPIGGTAAGESNIIVRSGTGIYIHDSENITVSGNQVGSYTTTARGLANAHAGIVLNGSSGCMIGPDNFLLGNGNVTQFDPVLQDTGGIVDYLGTGNFIRGNWVGVNPDGNRILGNQNGIVLIDTSKTQVGGPGVDDGNVIVSSAYNGLVLQGSATTGNFIGGNHIGVLSNPAAAIIRPGPNTGHGILVQDEANFNYIGQMMRSIGGQSVMVSSGNTIQNNNGDGIRVEGGFTDSNRILFNSISLNGGPGIRNLNGGNLEIVPPVITSHAGGRVIGTVDASIPEGSLVQVYSDYLDEGQLFKGQTTVSGGTFNVAVGGPLLTNLHATVTDPDGNTSQFGPSVSINAGFRIARLNPTVGEQQVLPGSSDSITGLFEATAINAIVEVHSLDLNVSASTTGFDWISLVSLYHDSDMDGLIDESDPLLAESDAVSESGEVNLSLSGAVVDPASPQKWILVVSVAASAEVGNTVSFSLSESGDIEASLFSSAQAPISATGEFPVSSDDLVVVGSIDPNAQWIATNFPIQYRDDPTYTAPTANPDGDPLVNLVERAFGTNPLVAETSPLTIEYSPTKVKLRFPWSKSATDLQWHVETSVDAANWTITPDSRSTEIGSEIDQILAEIDLPQGDNPHWFARLVLSQGDN